MNTYDNLSNPYGTDLIRKSSPIAVGPDDGMGVFSHGALPQGNTDSPSSDGSGSPNSGIDQPVSNDRIWTSGWYKSHNYVPGQQGWLLEGAQGFGDFADLRVGRLGMSIVQTATGLNSYGAISIENAADASAITVLKTGIGSGLYIRCGSTAGYNLDLLQQANVPAIRAITNNATNTLSVPAQFEQYVATNSNFYRMEKWAGGAAPAVALNIYVANNTTPNGTVTAPKGSLCVSSDGNLYINQDGSTTWKVAVLA